MNDRFGVSMFSWRIARAGGVLRSLLLFICGGAVLVGAALVLEPATLVAVTKPIEPIHSAQKTRDEFAETLSGLIANCKEVIAVNDHSAAAQASIVLWMADVNNPGVIDPAEVAVISHSPLLRTITVYSVDPSRADAKSASKGDSDPVATQDDAARVHGKERISVSGTPNLGRPAALRLSGPLDREAITASSFCDRWRATPSVQPNTIATGISDMRIEPLGKDEGDFSLLRLWLRWSPDSADGAGEATALIQRPKE